MSPPCTGSVDICDAESQARYGRVSGQCKASDPQDERRSPPAGRRGHGERQSTSNPANAAARGNDYNGRMDEPIRQVRVTASRPRDHIETIKMHAGERVGVGHRNQTYPEFVWGAVAHGPGGWVPEAYLEPISPKEARARRDYDAGQLTVVEGETLEVLDELERWLRCRNAKGVEGWVPTTIVEDTTGAP